ncbi:precorrin-2 dehydrogenase/sirohydrochlorin ferrochelatase family protein [Carboxylicivirga sp. RSCT41]|uniref:precorrin-2 dehydrogenase/sirohydrochlorin ferrochelatase family protein n=1 Tax=Carboxylicivirga agarovorans TaxID=3417570 RepID=UPI003D3309CE
MQFYPIHINIKDRNCLVVGGGKVAQRKVNKLLAAGAAVTVISKDLTPALQELVDTNRINKLRRSYEKNDIAGFFLVFAATNDKTTNQLVVSDAQEHGVLANSADGADKGDFIIPASCRVGHLNVGISTEGNSPALSACLRKYLMAKLSCITTDSVALIAEKRQQMLASGHPKHEAEMKALIDELISQIENNNVNLNSIK